MLPSRANSHDSGGGHVQSTNDPTHSQPRQRRPWPVKLRPLIPLDRILRDPHTVPHLLDFFGKRHCGQLLFCWMEMEHFKEIPEERTDLLLAQGRKIYFKYMDVTNETSDGDGGNNGQRPQSVLAKLLAPGAAEQLETHAESVLYQLERGCPDKKLFGLCQHIITREIKEVHYAEFLKSSSFRALLNNFKVMIREFTNFEINVYHLNYQYLLDGINSRS
jgi:hypothetical protein